MDKMSLLKNAGSSLKNNLFKEKLIGISEDFGKKTREKRKELEKVWKHLQTKLASGKVLIAYPAILKCKDENGRTRNVKEEEIAAAQSQ